MALDKLPAELHEEILSLLRPTDLSRLDRASKRLDAITKAALWKSACFLSDNGKVLCHRQCGFPLGHAGAAFELCREFTIASSEPHWTASTTERGACVACLPPHVDSASNDPDTLWLHEQLGQLKPGTLRSFAWLLGVCIPPQILGYNGVLARQRNLEEIFLVTCYDRLGIRCLARGIRLASFPHLRRLTWIGIHSSQLFILQDALEATSHQLTHLELDFLSPRARSWVPAGQFDSLGPMLGLSLPPEGDAPALPSLTSLVLTNVNVGYEFLARGLNLWGLDTLKLRCCSGWEQVLHHVCNACVNDREPGLPLKHFELHYMHPSHRQYFNDDDYTTVTELIPWCSALEEFALYVVPRRDPAVDATTTWLQHLLPVLSPDQCPNLRCFIFHVEPRERRELMDDNDAPFRSFFDTQAPNIGVEFLGLFGPLGFLWSFLESCQSNGSSKHLVVLHIRARHDDSRAQASSPTNLHAQEPSPGHPDASRGRLLTRDVWTLAQWLFDADAFPSLRLLAVGDFASLDANGRFILCRNEAANSEEKPEENTDRMRLLREDDHDLLDLLDRHMAAMLVGPNYSRPYLRSSGASLSANVWRNGLSTRLARESAAQQSADLIPPRREGGADGPLTVAKCTSEGSISTS